jgi:hypothetical protein
MVVASAAPAAAKTLRERTTHTFLIFGFMDRWQTWSLGGSTGLSGIERQRRQVMLARSRLSARPQRCIESARRDQCRSEDAGASELGGMEGGGAMGCGAEGAGPIWNERENTCTDP